MTDDHRTHTRVRVTVMLKPGVLDIQGNTVGRTLNSMGFDIVQSVRIGKVFEIEIPGIDPIEVRSRAEEMARRVMTNTVIENFTVEII